MVERVEYSLYSQMQFIFLIAVKKDDCSSGSERVFWKILKNGDRRSVPPCLKVGRLLALYFARRANRTQGSTVGIFYTVARRASVA